MLLHKLEESWYAEYRHAYSYLLKAGYVPIIITVWESFSQRNIIHAAVV